MLSLFDAVTSKISIPPMPKCKRPKIKAIPKEDVVAMFNELLAYTEQYEESDLIKVKYIRQFVFDKFNSLDAHE